MEWFGKRSFFDQREQSSQAMWMDIVLARQSGQELTNHYIITNSPVMVHLSRFFNASVRRLTAAYENIATAQALNDIVTSFNMRPDAWGGPERMGPRPPPWVPLLKSYGSSILSTSLGSKTVNNTSSLGLGGTKT